MRYLRDIKSFFILAGLTVALSGQVYAKEVRNTTVKIQKDTETYGPNEETTYYDVDVQTPEHSASGSAFRSDSYGEKGSGYTIESGTHTKSVDDPQKPSHSIKHK